MSWRTTTIGENCTVTSSKRFHLSERSESGVPFYCSKEIIQKYRGEEITECDYIREEFYLDVAKRFGVPQENDLLVTTRGTIGIPYLYRSDDRFYFADGNLTWIKDFKETLLPQFLYYWFLTHEGQKKVDAIAKGTAQKAVPIAGIKTLELNLPDITTQHKVVEILSSYDALIENNQKQIKLLEEAAQRLYKEWFVDLRFPGHETTPIVDGIPEGWAVKSILNNEIFKFVKSNVAPFEGKKQYYATADVSGTSIISAGEEVTFDKRPSRASIQPIPNSVWFARMSNSHKVLSCFGASESLSINAIISSGFAGFSSARETFGFVYATIASEFFDGEKNRYATGATQVSLTNEGLKNIKVLIPEYSIVVKYSKCVEPLLLKEEDFKRQIKLLCEARDRLLPRLMNGEIEV